jgi:hypothetical protein
MVLPLAWYALGCGTAGSGDPANEMTESSRDLTSLNSDLGEDAVVSDLELGLASAPIETTVTAGVSPASITEAPSADAELEAPVSAPALVSFIDGLDLASVPKIITASLPIMGAGAGTLLRPGVTVASIGEPMQLFRPVSRGNSPWPEAHTGQFPSVDRSGTGLVFGAGVGGGGGGHCPRPGM